MKKPFTLEVGESAIIGIVPGSLVTISLRDGKQYSASIEKIHATLARWHSKEQPTGRKRRKLFTSSEEYRKYRLAHPEEFRS